MFGELPKLFGREFAIGYFLPVCAIAGGVYFVLAAFGHGQSIKDFFPDDLAVGATGAVVSIWLVSVALLAMNRSIVRVLEGYGTVNPFRLIKFLQRWKFDNLQKSLEDVIEKIYAYGKKPPKEMSYELGRLQGEIARDFPSTKDQLLPTAFGNTIRAFEDYPRVVYGFEAIEGWDRLMAIIPQEYRDEANTTKTRVDFSVNVWLGASLLALGYVVMAIITKAAPDLWFPLVAVVVSWRAAHAARAAAYEWGVAVKAAFDVFLPELAVKLGYVLPHKASDQRRFWELLSQTFIMRSPDALSDLDKFRIPLPQRRKKKKRTKE